MEEKNKSSEFFLHKSSFIDDSLLKKLKDITTSAQKLRRIDFATYGTNIPYHLLDGDEIREQYPELLSLVDSIQPIAENFVGERLKLMTDNKRNFRIHSYRGQGEGILWHIDGASYTALITIDNDHKGGIEIFPLKISFLMIIPVYLFYFTQKIFTLFRPKTIICNQGDVLIIKGGRALHRTIPQSDGQIRSVLAISFDPRDRKTSWFRRNILNKLNGNEELVHNKDHFKV